jgi:hypothetical protein
VQRAAGRDTSRSQVVAAEPVIKLLVTVVRVIHGVQVERQGAWRAVKGGDELVMKVSRRRLSELLVMLFSKCDRVG